MQFASVFLSSVSHWTLNIPRIFSVYLEEKNQASFNYVLVNTFPYPFKQNKNSTYKNGWSLPFYIYNMVFVSFGAPEGQDLLGLQIFENHYRKILQSVLFSVLIARRSIDPSKRSCICIIINKTIQKLKENESLCQHLCYHQYIYVNK